MSGKLIVEKVRNALSRLPSGMLTILATLLILWLTLSPDPFGGHSPGLFPGSDKVAHFLMFGFLTVMALVDHVRVGSWRPAAWRFIVAVAVEVTVFGVLIEVAQLLMAMGRGFEFTDMLADAAGAAVAAWLWWLLQPRFCRKG